MNQAKVPVDSDKKEPQICVIEVSMSITAMCNQNDYIL